MTIAEGVQFCLLALALAGPIVYAFVWARNVSRADFIYNSGQTSLVGTVAGVICGNIGVGTFIGIGLFSLASPVVGISIALAYTAGLFLCVFVAPYLRAISKRHQAYGLIDLLVTAQGVKSPILVWLPVAFVFLLRAAVQLLALATLLSGIFGFSENMSVLVAAIATGGYTAIGGYRVAVRTDIFQAILIVSGVLVIGLSNTGTPTHVLAGFDLGPYRWPLLLGIWLFIPVSAVLAVDNWQRIVTARDLKTARHGYLLAAPLCLVCYLLIAWLGMSGRFSGDLTETLRNAMPSDAGWLADIMLIAVIMSTIDTFVMPLMSGLERSKLSLRSLQLVVLGFFAALAAAALFAGDLLNSIIAAFSALVAFLPAVVATFISKEQKPVVIVVSLNLGILTTLLFMLVDLNTAAFAGLVAATLPFSAAIVRDIGTRFLPISKMRS